MDDEDIALKRRIKAAMELAGLNAEQLATRINEKGLGPRTLRKLYETNAESRDAQPRELQAIAKACKLPYSFFTEGVIAPEPSGDLSDRVAALENELAAAIAALAVVGEELEQHFASDISRRVAEVLKPAQSKPQPKGQ